MADHLREQILDALVTTVTGLTTTGTNVHRLRQYPQEGTALPSLNVVQGDDQAVNEESGQIAYPYIDHRLSVRLEVRVQATSNVDQTLNLIEKEVQVALQADYTLGVTGVQRLVWLGTTEPELAELEKKTARMDVLWAVDYRTLAADPSQT